MERCDAMGYETPWIGGIVGEAAPSRHRVVESRLGIERDRPAYPVVGLISTSLGAGLEKERGQGAGIEACAWTAQEADGSSAGTTPTALTSGRHGQRLSQRTMDPEANRIGDPQRVRCPLSSESRLEVAPVLWLELPGAGEARDPAGRGCHRALEAAQVAGNKKKPEDLALTCTSSYRPTFPNSKSLLGFGLRHIIS
jgi:hypothetical protein